ncbi:hypothetical protein CRI67_21920 [Escherichia sp. E4702]|nr:hypothetical protein CRI67_21920 [Escherichia sp. E4702]
MKKTAPDGAVSGMPAIRETGPGKNLQAVTVSTAAYFVGLIRRASVASGMMHQLPGFFTLAAITMRRRVRRSNHHASPYARAFHIRHRRQIV